MSTTLLYLLKKISPTISRETIPRIANFENVINKVDHASSLDKELTS